MNVTLAVFNKMFGPFPTYVLYQIISDNEVMIS